MGRDSKISVIKTHSAREFQRNQTSDHNPDFNKALTAEGLPRSYQLQNDNATSVRVQQFFYRILKAIYHRYQRKIQYWTVICEVVQRMKYQNEYNIFGAQYKTVFLNLNDNR